MSGRDSHELKRTLGFWALLIYGVGDILGAGIYALVGEIAGIAGYYSWLAFLIAIIVAAVTGLSYAELVSRYPHSGGAAYFCQRAFGRPEPVLVIGWLVFSSGVFSMATLSHAFARYFGAMAPGVPLWLLIIAFLFAVCAVNFLGIQLSSLTNIVCTIIEIGGLVIVIGAGILFFSRGGEAAEPVADVRFGQGTWLAALAVLQAGALAFYACIGFEDLVNVAEETHRPERNLPLAILAAVGCAGLLYLATVTVCVYVISPQVLGSADAPLLDVVRRAAPAFPDRLFAFIPLFAVSNSALLNGIMASRLLYGMSREGLLPRSLSFIHRGRQTPYIAIGVVMLIASILALSGQLSFLAGSASVLLLVVFLLVHIALVLVKRRKGPPPPFAVPIVVPVVGSLICLLLAAFIRWESLLPAALMLALGLIIVGVHYLAMAGSKASP